MERKKREIEVIIECIQNVLKRSDGKPDWNSVAEIVRRIQIDQVADSRHLDGKCIIEYTSQFWRCVK